MLIHGLPEKFWVVTKPSPVSGLSEAVETKNQTVTVAG